MASKNKRSDFQNTTESLNSNLKLVNWKKIVRPHPLCNSLFNISSLFAKGEMHPTTFNNFLPLLKTIDRHCLIHLESPEECPNDKKRNNSKSKE